MTRQGECMIKRIGLFLALGVLNVYPESFSRDYVHGFRNGNLVPNWSFENAGQTWDFSDHGAGSVLPREKSSVECAQCVPRSGSFFAKVVAEVNVQQSLLTSQRLALRPGAT